MLHKFSALLLGLLVSTAHADCCDRELADPASAVKVMDAKVVSSRNGGALQITVLGTLKNATDHKVDTLVVEAKLKNAEGQVVDVLSEPLYGIVLPASHEVAFRLQGHAAAEAGAYATVEARVTSGETYFEPPPRASREAHPFTEFLVAWGPMLLLIGVWLIAMRKYIGKNSPQQKMLVAIGEQTALLARQTAAIESIAAAMKSSYK